jgi:hypothetical protein
MPIFFGMLRNWIIKNSQELKIHKRGHFNMFKFVFLFAMILVPTVSVADDVKTMALKQSCSTILNKLVIPMVDAVIDGGFEECVAEMAEPLAEFEVTCNAALDIETLGAGALVCGAAGAAIGSLCGVATIEGQTAGKISSDACDQIGN